MLLEKKYLDKLYMLQMNAHDSIQITDHLGDLGNMNMPQKLYSSDKFERKLLKNE